MPKRFLKAFLPGRERGHPKEGGFVLISVILFLAMFMVLGTLLMYKMLATVKLSGVNKLELARFQGAEGGAIAVSSYMAKYQRTDVPLDILSTAEYTVTTKVLGDTIAYPIGFSSLWKGVNVQLNSVSPPKPNDKSEVEMVVFIPSAPEGYGNEN